ncbi:hypothetical protein EYF80_031010 [Liparis tanakae]|uniref:Uncharacterized protein n=1 Tax=Liparis tanakae TaxID=230148 RepID=A0A4Z2H082_9TELE|nr:hypothetical protein EYF80_031010 [Liparis tanakae]
MTNCDLKNQSCPSARCDGCVVPCGSGVAQGPVSVQYLCVMRCFVSQFQDAIRGQQTVIHCLSMKSEICVSRVQRHVSEAQQRSDLNAEYGGGGSSFKQRFDPHVLSSGQDT